MTEEQWMTSTDPQAMLFFLQDSGKLSHRKARLFACACCRLIWHLLTDERSRRAVVVAEQFADGLASETERREAEVKADSVRANQDHPYYHGTDAAWYAVQSKPDAANAADAVAVQVSVGALNDEMYEVSYNTTLTTLANLLRDILGRPPIHPATLPPSLRTWNDGLIRRLAEQAYEQRQLPSGHLDNALLAVLADALSEAGCDDADIIGHLRGLRPHWRGCHILDALLGEG